MDNLLMRLKRSWQVVLNSVTGACWGMWTVSLPEDASLDGYRIDQTIHYTNSVILTYFSIVVAALVFFVWRYRHGKKKKGDYLTGDTKKSVFVTVCLGFLVFFTIDAVIEKMAFKDIEEAFWNFPKGKDVVKVEVMAQQFAWNFRYAGKDKQFGTSDDVVAELNQLRVPVDTPILLQMDAYDVIHSFFLPNFRVKQDVVPGRKVLLWFQAVKTGTYEIACAELCGNGHYRMRGFLNVLSKEDYNAWLNQQEELMSQPEEGGFDDWFSEPEESNQGLSKDWGWKWGETYNA